METPILHLQRTTPDVHDHARADGEETVQEKSKRISAAAATGMRKEQPFCATAGPAFWSYYYDENPETRQLGERHPCFLPSSRCNVSLLMQQQQQQQQGVKEVVHDVEQVEQQQQQAEKEEGQKEQQSTTAQWYGRQQQEKNEQYDAVVEQHQLMKVQQAHLEQQEQQKKLNSLLAQSLYDSLRENFPYILHTQYNYGFDKQGNIWGAYGIFPVPSPSQQRDRSSVAPPQ